MNVKKKSDDELRPECDLDYRKSKPNRFASHMGETSLRMVSEPIDGKRIKRVRWVHTDHFVVAVEVEAIIPIDDPSEPCYDAGTIQLLQEVERRAELGDIEWLREHGKVYEAVDAA